MGASRIWAQLSTRSMVSSTLARVARRGKHLAPSIELDPGNRGSMALARTRKRVARRLALAARRFRACRRRVFNLGEEPMTSTDYRTRIQTMFDGLARDARVEVKTARMGKPASAIALAEAAIKAEGKLPPAVEAFYREVNGFELEWRVKDDAPGLDALRSATARGLVRIEPIYSPEACGGVYSDWPNVYFSDDDPKRKIKPFDNFVAEACTALYPVPGSPMVHYHYFGEELHPTGYDFAGYIDRLLVARGYWYWMTSLCVDLQEGAEATAFRNDAALLFEDYDDELFVPKTSQGEVKP
jgi:hypothetical protein